MSFEIIADEVRDLFRVEFALLQPGLLILWANQSKASVLPTPTESWVRFSIRERRSRLTSLGNPGGRLMERPGFAVVEIYVPLGDGERGLRRIGDSVAGALQLKATTNVQFEETRLIIVGGEGQHYKGIALTDFTGNDFA
jgi:hypothetical protein